MTNIMSAISRFLTPEVVNQMASACGLDGAMAQKAVSAAVPSILSGLVEVAEKPGGARMLAKAVSEQPTDLLGNLVGSLTGSAQMAEKGTSMLSSLLGGSGFGILTSIVSKFLGVGEGSTRTLMGLLGPIVMGVLGREQDTGHLGANGLTRMLTEQKDVIAAALPPGLGKMLEASGLRDSIASAVTPDRRPDQARSAYPQSSTTDGQRASTGDRVGVRSSNWAYWVLPLLALGGLLWFLFPREERTVEAVPTTQPTSLPAPTRPATDAPAKVTFLTTAREDWTSIGASPNEYTNQDVYNGAGENLGTIRDLLIGPDGKAAAAVINVGRFLGIGDKEIAVPFSALRVERHGDSRRIVIDAMKEGVQAAPAFSRRAGAKQ
jgi:Bacterial protein of unknown function (DUF937)/PRC-barrel domain